MRLRPKLKELKYSILHLFILLLFISMTSYATYIQVNKEDVLYQNQK
jgi:hypothetical protein